MIFATALMLSLTTFSQEKKIKIGAFGALPLGSTQDVTKFGIGVEAAYLFETSTRLDLGFSTGYSYFTGKRVKVLDYDNTMTTLKYSDAHYIPVTVVARFNIIDRLSIGGDLGYAIGFGDGIKGGLYYKPRLGFQIIDRLGVNVAYTGLKVKDGTWKTLNFGIEFSI